MLENEYQNHLIRRIRHELQGAIVLKNDSNYLQGIPDIIILYKDNYAMLEVKRSEKASHRPNQEYYVDLFNGMSFGSFIFPENENYVLENMYDYLLNN